MLKKTFFRAVLRNTDVTENQVLLEVPGVQKFQNYSMWRIIMKFWLQH